MSHCRQYQQQRPSRPRLHCASWVHRIVFAYAVIAILQSANVVSAFAPTLSSSPTTSVCSGRQRTAAALSAKKRRRKASPGDDEEADNNSNPIPIASKAAEVDGEESIAGEDTPKQTTLSGGSSLIFEMARRMLVWDDELYEGGMLSDAGSRDGVDVSAPSRSSELSPSVLPPVPTVASSSLPRWRPSAIRQQSISNTNPSFRTSSPVMTNAGYASILRRNSRKRNKPSMWRHALRIYSKMGELEKEAREGDAQVRTESEGSTAQRSSIPGVGTNLASSANTGNRSTNRRKNKVWRSTAHHEAALVAASKLGMWEEALLIFARVEKSSLSNRRRRSRVTDSMVLSVISACVKGSKVKRSASSAPSDVKSETGNESVNAAVSGNGTETSNAAFVQSPSGPLLRELTVEERRKPLDMAREIILSMEERHDFAPTSRHINPLASAYNRLGLRSEAATLINEHLEDREPPPPPAKRPKRSKQKETREAELTSPLLLLSDDDLDEKADVDEEEVFSDGYEVQQLNVNQIKSKDRASYALLVQGAAMEGDWVGAVKELQRMTDAGLHPNTRNLNSFNEVMERGCRPTGNGKQNESDSSEYNYGGRRRRRSWKKKRDSIWLGNLR